MLKKSDSGVLASLKASTYPEGAFGPSLAAALPAERRVLARRGGWVGEKSGLLEHPAVISSPLPQTRGPLNFHRATLVFPQSATRGAICHIVMTD